MCGLAVAVMGVLVLPDSVLALEYRCESDDETPRVVDRLGPVTTTRLVEADLGQAWATDPR